MKIAARFWAKVNKTATCWLWTGGRGGNNHYGVVYIGPGYERAHRISWALANGPVPVELCVLHRCDVPLCVNPDHLFLGTQKDNAIDRETKGRGAKNLGNAKLSPMLAEIIRISFATGAFHRQELARWFGVCPSTITGILSGQTWGLV